MTATPTYNSSAFTGPNPNLNRLYDNVQGIIPDVQLSIVQMEAWNVIEDFYIQSTYERRQLHWQMATGVQEIDFNPWSGSWLVAWILEFDGLTNGYVVPPGKLLDRDTGTGQRSGHVLLALKPVSLNADLPASLFSTWFQVILNGVLSRIYSHPIKPYSSPQAAMQYNMLYRQGVARARAVADGSNTSDQARWRYPYFAGGRRKN